MTSRLGLDIDESRCILCLHFLLFFFFSFAVNVDFCGCTVHGMGPTVLFTHLKIILLQCFQFSAVSKRTPSNYIH